MLYLILGLVIFLGAHCGDFLADVSERERSRGSARSPIKGIYSLLCHRRLRATDLGIRPLARQHPILVYAPPLWMRHLTLLSDAAGVSITAGGYLPGRIKAALKHPMLAAVKTVGVGASARQRHVGRRTAVRRSSWAGGRSAISVKRRAVFGWCPAPPPVNSTMSSPWLAVSRCMSIFVFWLPPEADRSGAVGDVVDRTARRSGTPSALKLFHVPAPLHLHGDDTHGHNTISATCCMQKALQWRLLKTTNNDSITVFFGYP